MYGIREVHNNNKVNEIIKDAAEKITSIQYFSQSGYHLMMQLKTTVNQPKP